LGFCTQIQTKMKRTDRQGFLLLFLALAVPLRDDEAAFPHLVSPVSGVCFVGRSVFCGIT